MKRNDINTLLAITLIITATILRTASAGMHLYNFVPMAAMGVFSGAIIKDRRLLSLFVPLAGQFMADLYFQFFTNTPGFYPGQVFNYVAILAAALLGATMKQPKPTSVLGYVLGASGLFFVISNFGYYMSGYNGYSLSGFTKTYVDAIPFFKNTLAGDMVGGILLFGGFFLAQKLFISKLKKVEVNQ